MYKVKDLILLEYKSLQNTGQNYSISTSFFLAISPFTLSS